MTKRQVKKDPKIQKQKQKQQQNVVVNIGTGTIAKKRKPRQTKPKVQSKQDANIHQGIITRGPNIFYQQPQPQQVQQSPNINELFRLIQQQQRESIPTPPTAGGTFLNPVQPTASIVPPPAATTEAKQENDLERTRKVRVERFKPALVGVFEKENEGLGLEDKAYQAFNERPTNLFSQSSDRDLQLSIFGEADPGASINLQPFERIAPETVKPNFELEESDLLRTPVASSLAGMQPVASSLAGVQPATRGLGVRFKSALRGLVSEARENKDFFETAEAEGWPVIDVKQDKLREQREKRLAALAPIKTNKAPLEQEVQHSIVEKIDRELLEGGIAPIITPVDEVDQELELGFALNTAIEPLLLPGEGQSGITELNLEDQRQEEESPPPSPPYQGGEFLPAIVQPVANVPVIRQLFAPIVEPSLAAAVATQVRPADQYVTERLVKGLPEADARDAEQHKGPYARYQELAKDLGVKYSSSDGGRKGIESIKKAIRTSQPEGYVLPEYAKAKPGPKKKAAVAEPLTVQDA